MLDVDEVDDWGDVSSPILRLILSTIPLLGTNFELCVSFFETEFSTIGDGVARGKVREKSSSSRPGGFGWSKVKFFLTGSGIELVAGFAPSRNSVLKDPVVCGANKTGEAGMCETGFTCAVFIGSEDINCVVLVEGLVKAGKDTAEAAAVAAATAANSSSAFFIRSRSLRDLKVLLFSLVEGGC